MCCLHRSPREVHVTLTSIGFRWQHHIFVKGLHKFCIQIVICECTAVEITGSGDTTLLTGFIYAHQILYFQLDLFMSVRSCTSSRIYLRPSDPTLLEGFIYARQILHFQKDLFMPIGFYTSSMIYLCPSDPTLLAGFIYDYQILYFQQDSFMLARSYTSRRVYLCPSDPTLLAEFIYDHQILHFQQELFTTIRSYTSSRIYLRPSDTILLAGFIYVRPILPFPSNCKKKFSHQNLFSLIINMAERKRFKLSEIYLSSPVFSHGQLYVAFSRASSCNNAAVAISEERRQRIENYTR